MKMSRKITEDCLACGSCLPECQDGAIKEGDPIYTIDPAKCTDCAKCEVVCPTEAIKQV
jgi:NAD-dependent dihydropyrimidine dehydrogenase PreA subunit